MNFAVSLSGQWKLNQQDKAERIPATVPGNVHTDLLAAGQIPDPYIGENERDLQWIGESGWVYRRSFTADKHLIDRECILLRCEGLDTLATVLVNGEMAGTSDNMFRSWEFDIKDMLIQGENTIEVRFGPPHPYIKERTTRGTVSNTMTTEFFQVPGRQWVRKAPCNFGWDWGPTLITCGIWRPIGIVAYDVGRISDVQVRQRHHRNRVDLGITVRTEKRGRRSLTARSWVSYDGETISNAGMPVKRNKAEVTLEVESPRLWWPNGQGEQPLYEVCVEILDGSGNVVDTWTRRIGLRELTLDCRKDQWGQAFQFRCNDRPFFAKGANWIPADTFPARVTEDTYRRLVSDARAANMNMLRVWGGGYYENDTFYDICDELGICVWQDFMFSCMTYPAYDDEFMSNVLAEVEENIRRLRHHACLALWCGNNELEMFWVSDEEHKDKCTWQDYGLLFDELIPRTVRKLDPDTDYWPCSPHTPQKGLREDFNNADCGDAHLWDVWHGGAPFEWYRTCTHRFCSEFGFQSFPEPRTVASYLSPHQRNITHPMMEYHQRSWIGNRAIMTQVLDWFRMPKDFDSTLWLSQIVQGLGIKYGVEHWRRSMPRSMGTLYWQYNDCWPVASWSSVDWFGRWKALHYFAKRFYAPVLVSGAEDPATGAVEVHVTNDNPETVKGRVAWTLTDLQGEVIDHRDVSANVSAGKSRQVGLLRLEKQMAEHGAAGLLLWLDLKTDGETVAREMITLARPKQLLLEPPSISTEIRSDDDTGYICRLTTSRPALWVWLELKDRDARFSDNFFHIRPGEPIEIGVSPAEKMSLSAVRKALRIHDLTSTYLP